MKKAVSLSLASALTILFGGLGERTRSQSAAPDPAAAERLVVVARVEPPAAVMNRYTGTAGARVESNLGFRIQGKIVERLVDAGQVVKRGQPLMRIDETDYAHAVAVQAGNVAAAQAKWIQAAADEQRNRSLVAVGFVSKASYDQFKAAADSAKALLDAAIAQQKLTRNQEDYSVLLADGDGTVMETLAEPGQVVAAGQTVVRLAQAGAREAVVNLPETVRPDIGSLATATLYGGGVQVTARLRQLSDLADPKTRTFEARYVMDGAGASAPLGATVTIALQDDRQGGALSVPLSAIDDEGHGPGVWAIDPKTSKVAYIPVKVQAFGGETVEIEGALTAGDAVVAAGGHFLHEGERVRPAVIRAAMQ